MKFTINTKKLSAALSRVQSVIEARNTIPILSNVLLRADAESLRIEGTDLDTTINLVVKDVATADHGSVSVSAKMLADIVRKLKDGDCTLEASDSTLLVKAGRSRFKLATLPVDDWPTLSYLPPRDGFLIPSSTLKNSLEGVAFAMSSDDTRYMLNGVHMHCHEGNIRFVATDGHRLAVVDSLQHEMDGSVIIPKKAAHEAIKLCSEDVEVSISFSDSSISFETEGATLKSKLIDATYPDYLRIIPNDNDQRATVSVDALSGSVDRVASVLEDGSKAVKLSWSEYSVSVSVNAALNNAVDEVDAECNFSLDIGVNSKYLKDVLSKMSGDVEFAFKDSMSPLLMHQVDKDNYLCLIMPMRY